MPGVAAAAPPVVPAVAMPVAESAAVVGASPPVGDFKWGWKAVRGHLTLSGPG